MVAKIARLHRGSLFHVTFFNRLPTIAKRGLVPIVARPTADKFSSGGVVDDQLGLVYFTGPAGVGYWYDRAAAVAAKRCAGKIERGHVPVVLMAKPFAMELEHDLTGEQESGHPAYVGRSSVQPSELLLWTDSGWVTIDRHDLLDPSVALRRGKLLACKHNPLALYTQR